MNLSPDWAALLSSSGFEAVHWSSIGDPRAEHTAIMRWARENAYVVFTHDLDFGTILALNGSSGPSVLQVRTQDITSAAIGPLVLANLRRFERELRDGALIVIERSRSRVRILPLQN
jgi:predicted nuclease of predicted toxin-antitoxin system